MVTGAGTLKTSRGSRVAVTVTESITMALVVSLACAPATAGMAVRHNSAAMWTWVSVGNAVVMIGPG